MSKYSDHYSEEIGNHNFWIVKILFALVVILFTIMTFWFLHQDQPTTNEKTAAANSGLKINN